MNVISKLSMRKFVFIILILFCHIGIYPQYSGNYKVYEQVVYEDSKPEETNTLVCDKIQRISYRDKWKIFYDSLGYGGYKDELGQVVLQNKYCKVFDFNRENTAWVRNCDDGKFYMINRNGDFISSGYDYYQKTFDNNSKVYHLVGKKNGNKIKQGIVDNTGEVLIPLAFDRVIHSWPECYELFECYESFKFSNRIKGCLYNLNKQIVVPKCRHVDWFAENFDKKEDGIFIDIIGVNNYIFNVNNFAVKINRKIKLNSIYKSTYLIVYKLNRKENLYGALSKSGEEIVPCVYGTVGNVEKILDAKFEDGGE